MRIHFYVHVFVFSVFFYFLSNSSILATQPVESTTRLPKVLVKAQPIELLSPIEGADVTRITDKDLKRTQAITIVEALRGVPGVDVIQSGGVGQPAHISLRGTPVSQTVIILDGMPVNDVGSDNGALDLSSFLVDDLAEIQVIRGPLSGVYGSGGIGGVVKIDTKKGQSPFRTLGKAEGGAYQTYQQNLGFQGQEEFLDYHIMTSRLHSNGSPFTPDRYRGKLMGKPDDPVHQENFSSRLGLGKNDAHLSLFTRYTSKRLGFHQRGQWELWRQDYQESYNRLQADLESQNGSWSHRIGIAQHETKRNSQNPNTFSILGTKGAQTRADWHQILKLSQSTQVFLATEVGEDKFSFNKNGASTNHAKTTQGDIALGVTFQPIDTLKTSTSIRTDKYKELPSVTTYRIGGEYQRFGGILKGSIGTGFKAPSLFQRFNENEWAKGNPNLKPEKSIGWDLGVDRAFFQEKLSLGITVFQNRIRNQIDWRDKTYINIGLSRTQGFEAYIKFQLTEIWRIGVNHTYTRAWDIKTGLELLRRPQNKTLYELIGQITPSWQVSGSAFYVGSQKDIDDQTFKRKSMPSYTVFRAETSYQLNDHWQVYGRGENLTNKRYESPDGYQQPGFGLYVGVRAKC